MRIFYIFAEPELQYSHLLFFRIFSLSFFCSKESMSLAIDCCYTYFPIHIQINNHDISLWLISLHKLLQFCVRNTLLPRHYVIDVTCSVWEAPSKRSSSAPLELQDHTALLTGKPTLLHAPFCSVGLRKLQFKAEKQQWEIFLFVCHFLSLWLLCSSVG